jgi:hypothetical protein
MLGPWPGLCSGLASGSQRPGRYFGETAMPPRNDDSAEVLISKDFVAARCFTKLLNKDVWS